MRVIVAIALIVFSIPLFAGGGSEQVELLSLNELENNEYVLKYRSIKSNEIYTVYLSYRKWNYIVNARFLTKDKYEKAINLLKEQIAQPMSVRFGWFGGGPCVVDKNKNIYRSDALDIYEGKQVVYAFCEYK